MSTPIDSTFKVELPEGIEFELSCAGPVPRGLAWVLDFLLRVLIYLVFSSLLAVLGRAGLGLLLIAIFLLEWLYPVGFEVYGQGATPGKRALGLRVVHDDATPVGLGGSMIRNLIRFVDFLPLLYGVGVVCCLVDGRFRRLGDLAAGTVVVHEQAARARAEGRAVQACPPPVILSREERQSVLDFAERAPRLTPERAEELASLVAPRLAGRKAAEGNVQALYSVAAYLVGGGLNRTAGRAGGPGVGAAGESPARPAARSADA